ncbi:MAG: hypothetical protein NT069_28610, partial [Planctomycetota bacterium]|nr:hypothetical protein [Planctomycetota bacterium]
MIFLSVLSTKESVLDMVYESHAVEFHGQEAVDFEGAESWRGPDFAYRLRTEYEDENRLEDKLDLLLQQPGADGLTSLIIGAWNGAHDGDNSAECIAALVDRAGKLSHLKALFFGDITYEEYEISWIVQSDVSPLLTAFPGLETLRVRGGTELSFSPVRHENLREFAVETGGLGSSILREIFLCQFPNLETIELHLGMPDYGFDGTVDDLQPVLTGKLHPKLKSLGLLNSEITDDIAAIVVNAPII